MNIRTLPADVLIHIFLAAIAGFLLGISLCDDSTPRRALAGFFSAVLTLILVYRLFFL